MKISSATAATAATTLLLQITALIALEPKEFGLFSIIYLLFAFSGSVGLSLISDSWTRSAARNTPLSSWFDYGTVSLYFSLLAGLLALIVGLAIAELANVAVFAGIAVSAGTYRNTARYFSLKERDWKRVLPGDLAGLVGMGLVIAITVVLQQLDLYTIFLAWAVSSVVSALLSRAPAFQSMRVLKSWFVHHGPSMRPLIRDSVLMDAGAIWAPYIMIPILGVSSFGLYRAVSNVAAPVRLVITPLRPMIASIPLSAHRSPRLLLSLFAASLAAGVGAWGAIELIDRLHLQLGTLSSLTPYALAVGIFVLANLLGHFYSIVARNHLNSRTLLAGRLTQAILSFAAPVLAALQWGLSGAIWAIAVGSLTTSLTWQAIIVTRRSSAHTSL